MATSPELTGGSAFAFEDKVTATYLASLLFSGTTKGMTEFTTESVEVQRGDLGDPLDDLIINAVDRFGAEGKISLQIKQALTISEAATNVDFREIVLNSRNTLLNDGFRKGIDRFGAATFDIAKDKARAARNTFEWARDSKSHTDFYLRVNTKGHASDASRGVVESFRSILSGEKGESVNEKELWDVLRHFVLLQFDVMHEGSDQESDAIERLRLGLSPKESDRAADLWRSLCSVAQSMSGRSGSIDRPTLFGRLSPSFALDSDHLIRQDLLRISEEANHIVQNISNDIGGLTIPRPAIVDEIDDKLENCQIVQITGHAGTGKSAVLRSLIERQLSEGFAIVLSWDRLSGSGWPGYAQHLRLESTSLSDLLLEMGARSNPIVFLDGIDRIQDRQHQAIVKDIIRTIQSGSRKEKWKVVTTVRDENIEHVRTWLPDDLIDSNEVVRVGVDSFSDEEAGLICASDNSLRHLLFGPNEVREIARRPFFLSALKRLHPSELDSDTPSPASEIELIEAWWRGGGYDATQSDARARQKTLLALAESGMPTFGRNLSTAALSPDCIQSLVIDGVIRDVVAGHTVKFSHDIFFEWSLLHLLISKGDRWLQLIVDAGEPPAFGRAAELLSAWSFEGDNRWEEQLSKLEETSARTQWVRCWLVAPISSSKFYKGLPTFNHALFTKDSDRLKRIFVWSLATKTQPNPMVLEGRLGLDEMTKNIRLDLADLLALPNDIRFWIRLVNWTLSEAKRIPANLTSFMLSVFGIFQNAVPSMKNDTSSSILKITHEWLVDIEGLNRPETPPLTLAERVETRWDELQRDERGELRRQAQNLLLLGTLQAPELVENYLERLLVRPDSARKRFRDIAPFSPRISATNPRKLCELLLVTVQEDLPEEKVRKNKEHRKRFTGVIHGRAIDHHDWDTLSLDRHAGDFFPPAPNREPFLSLFQNAPTEALNLVKILCNHAMSAWRQLHLLDYENRSTPIPLILEFPWGSETYWGDGRVYGAYRGGFGPDVLNSALMSLEDWAYNEVENGRDVNEVIKDVVSENTCCAVLGIASGLMLQEMKPSTTTLPIASSQRLWSWDLNRLVSFDTGSNANEIGAMGSGGNAGYLSALRKSNQRQNRKYSVRDIAPAFALIHDSELRQKYRDTLASFPENLPYEQEEDRDNLDLTTELKSTAQIWSTWGDKEYYKLQPTPDENQVQVMFESPHAESEEVKSAHENSVKVNQWFRLAAWCRKSIENNRVDDDMTIGSATTFAKAWDCTDLFQKKRRTGGLEDQMVYSVTGTAAVILKFAENVGQSDLDWAVEVVERSLETPEPSDGLTMPSSVVFQHPLLPSAVGFGEMIRRNINTRSAKASLLTLIGHPLHSVSVQALSTVYSLIDDHERFSWIALDLGIRLSIVSNRSRSTTLAEEGQDERRRLVDNAVDQLYLPTAQLNPELTMSGVAKLANTGKRIWCKLNALIWSDSRQQPDDSQGITKTKSVTRDLPEIPPAWIYATTPKIPGDDFYSSSQSNEPVWRDPDEYIRQDYLIQVLNHLPIYSLLNGAESKEPILSLAEALLKWTMERLNPPWEDYDGRHYSNISIEWRIGFPRWLAILSSHLPATEVSSRFVGPILLMDDNYTLDLLEGFIPPYTAASIIDAQILDVGVRELLDKVAVRISNHPCWTNSHHDYDRWPNKEARGIIRALLFTEYQDCQESPRFANGVWSDLPFILPIVKRVLDNLESNYLVLAEFVTLCERASKSFPSDLFVQTILDNLDSVSIPLSGSDPQRVASRIASLTQVFSERDKPLNIKLQREMLSILDTLVDFGDRRSAALQSSELFRETSRPAE